MRHCSFCGNEVYAVDGCEERKLVFDDDSEGTIRRDPEAADLVDPIPCGEEDAGEDLRDGCSVCRAELGHYHHPGCTVEECPNCGGKLANCDCNPHALTREGPER